MPLFMRGGVRRTVVLRRIQARDIAALAQQLQEGLEILRLQLVAVQVAGRAIARRDDRHPEIEEVLRSSSL